MHDDHIAFGPLQALAGQTEQIEVLLDRREEHARLPLELHAQHHDHVGAGDGFLEV